MISKHHDEIVQLVVALKRFETLTGDEIDRVLDGVSVDDLRTEEETGEPTPIEVEEESEETPATDEVTDGEELKGELPGEPGLSPA